MHVARLLALGSPLMVIVASSAFVREPTDWTMVWFGAAGAVYMAGFAWWLFGRRDSK